MIKRRNFGLDVIRAAAIFFVLLTHGSFLLPQAWFEVLDYFPFGLFGVELFFVLSGYLIGQIFIRDCLPQISWHQIRSFWMRRWLRTLPAYYLVLLFLIISSNWSLPFTQWNFHPGHFFFLQNFSSDEIHFFPVSWSLSIEEWFYLLLPIALAFLLKQSKRSILQSLLILIAVVITARLLYVGIRHPEFDFGVRKYVPVRFDSLLIGVVLAYLKIFARPFYQRLTKARVGLIGFLGSLFIFAYYLELSFAHQFHQAWFPKTFGFPVLNVCMALTIPWMETSPFINQAWGERRWLAAPITYTSLYTYSLYLIHADVIGVFKPVDALWLKLGGSIAIMYALSALLYHFWEEPLLRLRDRLYPTQSILTNETSR